MGERGHKSKGGNHERQQKDRFDEHGRLCADSGMRVDGGICILVYGCEYRKVRY